MSYKQFNRRQFVRLAGITGAAIPMTSMIRNNRAELKSETSSPDAIVIDVRSFPLDSIGVLPLQPTRSKEHGMRTAKAHLSGTRSPTHLAKSQTATPAMWPMITTIVTKKM